MLYENCKMITFQSGCEEDTSTCDVRIDGETLIVSYDDTIYRGNDSGGGHYDLIAPMVNGRATLHRAKDSDTLEGSWIEGGFIGMWQIELSDETRGK
ncbi:hypothetical protein K6W37_09455 [Acetobacter senegalensis]|uniref:hypothetical protein n=1 Tax=Acetobacter TaxID=434 RepID=UPI001EDAF0CF|nr:hypothetical protein [Acetobacter senegalensis]MCG4254114.1 hypothetical protein [Acetobacter senegalensis]